MPISKSKLTLALVFLVSLPSTHVWAHWCDDMWISAYNIVVRPDSDTSPKALYVQNNMGYQLQDRGHLVERRDRHADASDDAQGGESPAPWGAGDLEDHRR